MPQDPPTDIVLFREKIKFLEARISRDQTEYWLNWVCFEQKEKNIIGQIEASLQMDCSLAYLAYFTFPKYWKLGYAIEGCKAIINHLFDEWGAKKIMIEIDTRNIASINMVERLGAKRVGVKEKADYFKDSWSDEYVYEILTLV